MLKKPLVNRKGQIKKLIGAMRNKIEGMWIEGHKTFVLIK